MIVTDAPLVRLCACCVLAATVSTSCAPAPGEPQAPAPAADPAAFSGERALEEVSLFVALGPRHSGTEGAETAAHYLVDRLTEIGVPAALDVFTDPVPDGEAVFRNVTATFPAAAGAADLIIVGSHYDTKSGVSPDFAGANDSGSSTGLLLELARVLKQTPPLKAEIMLAFFDGEECRVAYGPRDGLHGSRRLAKRLVMNNEVGRTRGVIIVDMIGDRDLMVRIPRNSSRRLTSLAFEAARAEGARLKFGLHEGDILDDHVPFANVGAPAIDLIDFEYGSGPGKDDYWHTPEDTMDKLSAESLRIVGRVVVRMINALAAGE